jgi:cytochrome c-type biogenesis protein CcmH/NrfG
MWAIQAGVDWDWELPVVTIIFFALGGMVLARRGPAASTDTQTSKSVHPQRRVVLALGCLLLGVAPVYVWLSQRKLDQASAAFSAGNCHAAISAARSSISLVGSRAQPYAILAYCDARRGTPQLAVAAIDKAVSLDPHNPDYVLDLAIIRAAAGLDPMKAAKQALALDPRGSDAQSVWQTFKYDKPTQWQADGQAIVDQSNTV